MTKQIIISYVPLLQADKAEIYTTDNPILFGVNTQPMVTACLWGRYQSAITPVFAIQRAKEVAAHLKEWSEGKPEEWFKLFVTRIEEKYVITLFPDLKKVWEKVRERNPGVDLKNVQTICKPMFFISEDIKMFSRVQWQTQSYLGLIDQKDVNAKDIPGMIEPTIIGLFPLGDSKSIESFVKVLMKNK